MGDTGGILWSFSSRNVDFGVISCFIHQRGQFVLSISPPVRLKWGETGSDVMAR